MEKKLIEFLKANEPEKSYFDKVDELLKQKDFSDRKVANEEYLKVVAFVKSEMVYLENQLKEKDEIIEQLKIKNSELVKDKLINESSNDIKSDNEIINELKIKNYDLIMLNSKFEDAIGKMCRHNVVEHDKLDLYVKIVKERMDGHSYLLSRLARDKEQINILLSEIAKK